MNLWSQVNKGAPRATLFVVVCFLALMIYIVSDRQQTVYFTPDVAYTFLNRTISENVKTEYAHSTNWEYFSTTEQTTLPWNNVTSSMTTYKYSSAELIPKINMTQLIQKYQMQRNNIARNISNDDISIPYKFDNPLSQHDRIDLIRRTCRNQELFRHHVYSGHYNTVYYYSSRYEFSYCKVPKSGSTLWTQVFDILKHGVSDSRNVFAQKRGRVHASMSKYTVKFNSNLRRQSLSILVSRDPFSRLYSAYVDKSYLLVDAKTNFAIRRKMPKVGNRFCPVNVTFQDFLDYILFEAKKGKMLNRHWTPIFNLCRPCDVDAYILVKQESFAKDVEVALHAFGVEKNKLEVIASALKEHRVEATIPGVIQTVYSKFQHSKIRHCTNPMSIAQRLWKSFIIQGYINETLRFPADKFKSGAQYSDMHYLTEIILHTINEHKMTSSAMKSQRHQALVDAYSEINDTTIGGIKELYKIDFEMFGYSTVPPSVNK